MSFIDDAQFGRIVDFDTMRTQMRRVYDSAHPEFNMLAGAELVTEISKRHPSYAVSIGASALSYGVLCAAEEHELAEELKDNIFTLGWTEEHTGTDLLSIRTQATPMSDAPDEKNYHIKGTKWIINCSYHADYHIALAKVNPESDSPRSLSFFLIPRSSIKKWTRIETHVMREMILTEFEIDGPGRLIGKVGHGLSILQRMAMPSKYQCCYMGISMLYVSLPAAFQHLSSKRIFGNNPIRFSNVFRQLYDITLKAALQDFIYHRAVVFNGDGFLQFHGTMLKSYVLLRIHEILDENLLITGSKGFTRESTVGRDAQDSALLPVFDGHYTLNTLMTAKHFERYITATDKISAEDRIEHLRRELFVPIAKNEIYNKANELRKPPFFDFVDYIRQMAIPFPIDPQNIMDTLRSLNDEIRDRELGGDGEYKYKTGDMLHWTEGFMAACEMWKLFGDKYQNIIAIQYNGLVNIINETIAEGGMTTEFMAPVRLAPLPDDIEDPQAYLLDLLNLREKVSQPVLTF